MHSCAMTTLMLRRKISSPGLRPSGQKQHRGWRLWLRAYRRLDHCVMENVAITRLAVHCTHNGPKGNHRHVVHQYERCSPAPKYCVCLTKPDHCIYVLYSANYRQNHEDLCTTSSSSTRARWWGAWSGGLFPRLGRNLVGDTSVYGL